MTRLALIALLTAVVVLGFLGIMFLKDSYKLLPIQSTQTTAKPFEGWHDFQSPSGKFRVMFPALPQHATQTMKDPKTKVPRYYDMYVAEKNNGSTFVVSTIRFPDNKESPDMIQKTVLNDLMAANPTNQLKDMKAGVYRQYNTLDFTIVNNDMTIQGMTFMDGDTLYLLSVLARNASFDPSEVVYFIKSFDLSPKNVGK